MKMDAVNIYYAFAAALPYLLIVIYGAVVFVRAWFVVVLEPNSEDKAAEFLKYSALFLIFGLLILFLFKGNGIASLMSMMYFMISYKFFVYSEIRAASLRAVAASILEKLIVIPYYEVQLWHDKIRGYLTPEEYKAFNIKTGLWEGEKAPEQL